MIRRTPVSVGYGRVSHIDSHSKGDSLPAQAERCKEYREKELPDTQWGGMYDDGKNISAYRTTFHRRPGGKEVLKDLQHGDHLVVDRVDRLWRNVKDFCNLMELLDNRGITLHITQFVGGGSFNTNTKMGRWIMQMWVMFGELESIQKSDRTKEGLAVARKQGRANGPLCPTGCKSVTRGWRRTSHGNKAIRYMVWDETMREFMDFALDTKFSDGHNWTHEKLLKVSHKEVELGLHDKVITNKQELQKRGRSSLWRAAVRNAAAFRFLKITEPCQIPKVHVLQEAEKQYNNRMGVLDEEFGLPLGNTGKRKKLYRRYKKPFVFMSPQEVLEL